MPLTRGEAVGYDADLMVFKFTMRNGEQIVQCQISNAALGDLAGRWRGAARDLPAEFEAHRELIEAIASEQFDQTSSRGNEVGPHFFETHSEQHSAKVKTRIGKTHSVRLGPTDGRPIVPVRMRHLPPEWGLVPKKVNKSST